MSRLSKITGNTTFFTHQPIFSFSAFNINLLSKIAIVKLRRVPYGVINFLLHMKPIPGIGFQYPHDTARQAAAVVSFIKREPIPPKRFPSDASSPSITPSSLPSFIGFIYLFAHGTPPPPHTPHYSRPTITT